MKGPHIKVANSIILALFLLQGCASSKPKTEPETETVPFKSEIKAVPVPVQADIATDMTEMTKATLPKAKPKPKPRTKPSGKRSIKTRFAGKGRKPESGFLKYVVKEDDTLMKISFLVFGDVHRWREIFEDNKAKITDPNLLKEGTVFKIRAASFAEIEKNGHPYLIRRNDTLVKISDGIYGTRAKWRRLWENNRQLIHDPDKIYAGFYLYYLMTEKDKKDLERHRGNKKDTLTRGIASTP